MLYLVDYVNDVLMTSWWRRSRPNECDRSFDQVLTIAGGAAARIVRVFLLEKYSVNIVDKEAFQKIKKQSIIPAVVLSNNSEALLNYSGREFYLHDNSRLIDIY